MLYCYVQTLSVKFIGLFSFYQGNTVLHYSISHGNFDVVSSILDTGVCNVNLTNDAGYSSVMLVSLADIKNDDEMKIITRLFKCGDVNLQAKKVSISKHAYKMIAY